MSEMICTFICSVWFTRATDDLDVPLLNLCILHSILRWSFRIFCFDFHFDWWYLGEQFRFCCLVPYPDCYQHSLHYMYAQLTWVAFIYVVSAPTHTSFFLLSVVPWTTGDSKDFSCSCSLFLGLWWWDVASFIYFIAPLYNSLSCTDESHQWYWQASVSEDCYFYKTSVMSHFYGH